jgi:glycosyltransferase involved in cell wall biosynthesis
MNHSRHVVMLAPFGVRPKGTLQSRMLPLAQALAPLGWRATIVAPPLHNPEDAGRREQCGDVTLIHSVLPRAPADGPRGALTVAAILARAALREQPDLLHLFKPKGHAGLAALALRALQPRLPLVVDCDDWEGWGGWNDLAPYSNAAKHLFAWQERDLPRRAQAVTVASRALQTLVWAMGVPPATVFYLPNGGSAQPPNIRQHVARAALGLGDEPLVLLYTRFWEFDVTELVQTLVAIRQGCPAACLVVVGKGERGEENELQRRMQRAGLGAMLDYRGWVAPDSIPHYLAAADLLLYPMADTLVNRAKCPAKLLEPMVAGLPIVAGRVGQAAEYLEHGRSGLLVPPHDPAALAHAALELLDSSQLRRALGHAAQARATSLFAWETLAPAAAAAYAAALTAQ